MPSCKKRYHYAHFAYQYAVEAGEVCIDCTLKIIDMNTNTNHEISLQDAIEMTTRYRANRPSDFPVCETFEIAAIQKLLATPGCESLRIYYGMKENMESHAILVAVDSSGGDILPEAGAASSAGGEVIILEDSYRCPPLCPKGSPLNDQ